MSDTIPDKKVWVIEAKSLFDESWDQWGTIELSKEDAVDTFGQRKKIHFARTFRLVEQTVSSKVVEG